MGSNTIFYALCSYNIIPVNLNKTSQRGRGGVWVLHIVPIEKAYSNYSV